MAERAQEAQERQKVTALVEQKRALLHERDEARAKLATLEAENAKLKDDAGWLAADVAQRDVRIAGLETTLLKITPMIRAALSSPSSVAAEETHTAKRRGDLCTCGTVLVGNCECAPPAAEETGKETRPVAEAPYSAWPHYRNCGETVAGCNCSAPVWIPPPAPAEETTEPFSNPEVM